MKPDQLYQELKDLAEKLGISVTDQNLRKTGIRVESGYCKVKGRDRFVMDKHLPAWQKVERLADFLSTRSHENIYVVPAVREVLHKHAAKPQRQGPPA